MNSSIGALIEYIVKRCTELGISRRELARRSGMDPGSLGNIMAGRVTKSPAPDTIQKLSKGLQVDEEELGRFVRGNGPEPTPKAISVIGSQAPLAPIKPALTSVHELVNPETVTNKHEICGSSDQSHVESVWEKQAALLAPAGTLAPLGKFVGLPMYGYINCGEPCVIPDEPQGIEYWNEREAKGADGTLIATGTSMLAAGFTEGAILFIKRLNGEQPQPGKKVIVNIKGDGCMCKEYCEDPKWGPYLKSLPGEGESKIIHITPEMTIVAQVLRHTVED